MTAPYCDECYDTRTWTYFRHFPGVVESPAGGYTCAWNCHGIHERSRLCKIHAMLRFGFARTA